QEVRARERSAGSRSLLQTPPHPTFTAWRDRALLLVQNAQFMAGSFARPDASRERYEPCIARDVLHRRHSAASAPRLRRPPAAVPAARSSARVAWTRDEEVSLVIGVRRSV